MMNLKQETKIRERCRSKKDGVYLESPYYYAVQDHCLVGYCNKISNEVYQVYGSHIYLGKIPKDIIRNDHKARYIKKLFKI